MIKVTFSKCEVPVIEKCLLIFLCSLSFVVFAEQQEDKKQIQQFHADLTMEEFEISKPLGKDQESIAAALWKKKEIKTEYSFNKEYFVEVYVKSKANPKWTSVAKSGIGELATGPFDRFTQSFYISLNKAGAVSVCNNQGGTLEVLSCTTWRWKNSKFELIGEDVGGSSSSVGKGAPIMGNISLNYITGQIVEVPDTYIGGPPAKKKKCKFDPTPFQKITFDQYDLYLLPVRQPSCFPK